MAIKVLLLQGPGAELAEAELQALTFARHPNIVKLLTSERCGDHLLLVTDWEEGVELCSGDRSWTWEELRRPVEDVLSALSLLHRSGWAHGDLAPRNLILRPDGSGCLLDLGLAGQAERGLAQAQSADLQQLGVLIERALASDRAVALPEGLRHWLGWLRDAQDPVQPRSAALALHRLRHLEPPPPLPWVGDGEQLEQLVRALEQGSACSVWLPPGMGRSRLLREVEERLVARGHRVWRVEATRAGEVEHLAEVLRAGEPVLIDHGAAVPDLPPGPCLRIAERPGPGVICMAAPTPAQLESLFVGPERLLHLRSGPARALWHHCRGRMARAEELARAWVEEGLMEQVGGRLRARPGAAARLLARPPELAVGPEAQRYGGLLPALRRSLAWVALAGEEARADRLARWRGLPLHMLSAELEGLEEKGLLQRGADGALVDLTGGQALHELAPEERREAHAQLAEGLDEGSEARMVHLLRAGRAAEAQAAGLRRLERLFREGRLVAALELGLMMLRWSGREARPPELAPRLCLVALATESLHSIRQVWAALEHLPEAAGLRDLLGQWLKVVQPGAVPEEGLAEAAAAPEVDERLRDQFESVRRSMQAMQRSRAGDLLGHGQAAEEGVAWAQGRDPALLGRALHVMAHQRYISEDYKSAVELASKALALRDRPDTRLSTDLLLASAQLDLGEVEEAGLSAGRALKLARELGHEHYEARAEWLIRKALAQSPQPAPVDQALVEASSELEPLYMRGLLLMAEATLAWRGERLHQAHGLLQRAIPALEQGRLSDVALVARALRWHVQAAPPAAERASILAQLGASTPRSMALQVRCLLCADPPDEALLAEVENEMARAGARPGLRLEVLSWGEMLQLAGG